jgi:hypothetical protein
MIKLELIEEFGRGDRGDLIEKLREKHGRSNFYDSTSNGIVCNATGGQIYSGSTILRHYNKDDTDIAITCINPSSEQYVAFSFKVLENTGMGG